MFSLWSGFGNTAGVHRLWCHRSYQAAWPFRVFLMIGHTLVGHYTLHTWSVGHRTHHKFADTDADPHNVQRGFTFSHLGWSVMKEHPMVEIKSRTIDFSDILRDPVAKFQYDHYYSLYFLFSVVAPTLCNMYFCGETMLTAFIIGYAMRTVTVTHDTALVNSAAHMFGDKPYNSKIESVENTWVSVAAVGEGYVPYLQILAKATN